MAKKRINCSVKGKSSEREVVRILNERFKDLLETKPSLGGFSRSVASGARWGQKVTLSEAAVATFSGDISVPGNDKISFLFSIENKCGYPKIDLTNAVAGSVKELDSFLEQAMSDSKRCGRKPMLIWKKDRRPRLVFILKNDLGNHILKFDNYIIYDKVWVGVELSNLLKLEDNYFFNI